MKDNSKNLIFTEINSVKYKVLFDNYGKYYRIYIIYMYHHIYTKGGCEATKHSVLKERDYLYPSPTPPPLPPPPLPTCPICLYCDCMSPRLESMYSSKHRVKICIVNNASHTEINNPSEFDATSLRLRFLR
jgi:hypothetical protein